MPAQVLVINRPYDCHYPLPGLSDWALRPESPSPCQSAVQGGAKSIYNIACIIIITVIQLYNPILLT